MKSKFNREDVFHVIRQMLGEKIKIMYDTGKIRKHDLTKTDIYIYYNSNAYKVHWKEYYVTIYNNDRRSLDDLKRFLQRKKISAEQCNVCYRSIYEFNNHHLLFNAVYNLCTRCHIIICKCCIYNLIQEHIYICPFCKLKIQLDSFYYDPREIKKEIQKYIALKEGENKISLANWFEAWQREYPEFYINHS